MSARWSLPAVAVFAAMAVIPARAQEPSPPEPQDTAQPRAVARGRSERAGDTAQPVRSPRRESADGSGSQEGRVRARPAAAPAAAPAAEPAAAATPEEQGGARRRGGGGGGGTVGSGRSGRGDGGSASPRQGGVRRPDGDGGGSDRSAQAIPRSRAPRPPQSGGAWPSYGRRYYAGPTGLGYYFYDPWSWYAGGYGWGGYGAYGNWGGGYYGSPGYYGGGYGAYGGPYGWSIGGVRLKVNMRDAEVYVDGYYAGIVDDFDGVWQQLRLDEGGYRIEIRKPGYATLSFDVRVQPGRTITYRGELITTP